MASNIEIRGDALIVHIKGLDKLLAVRSTFTVPLSHVKNPTARPPDARFDEMKGVRLGGGYWPGAFAAGHFWVTGGLGGGRQEALQKLADASALLAKAEGTGEARDHLDHAIAALKQNIEAMGLPEAARYLAFYDVHDPANTVGFDLVHERFRRVVVELDEEAPEAAVARISAALAPG
jgi:hypothetical protein